MWVYSFTVSNLGKAAKLVASLIVQHNWIFSGQEVEEEVDIEAAPGDENAGILKDRSQIIDDKETAALSPVSKDGAETSLPLSNLDRSLEELTKKANPPIPQIQQ